MDKTHNISLGGFSFIIENGAASQLSAYLTKVRQYLGQSADTDEILTDVEQRMAELLKARMQNTEVVTSSDIDYLIQVMGKPEQYVQDDEELTSEKPAPVLPLRSRKLYRDISKGSIGGVLSGLSYYFQIDVTLLRIIYMLPILLNIGILSFTFNGSAMSLSTFSILLYVVLWLVIPPAKTTAERLEMKGVEVNIDTLSAYKTESETPQRRQWLRSTSDKWLMGVLGGLAKYFSIPSIWLRIGVICCMIAALISTHVRALLFVLLYGFLAYGLKKDNEPDSEQDKQQDSIMPLVDNTAPQRHSRSILGQFFHIMFKGASYFLVMIFIFIVFILLLMVLSALLGIGIFSGASLVLLHNYLDFFLTESWQQVLFYLSTILLIVLFISIFTLLIMKVFSAKGYQTPRWWFAGNILITLMSFLGVFALVTRRSFISYNAVEEKHPIAWTSDTLFIREKTITPFSYSLLVDSKGVGRSGDVHFLGLGTTQQQTPYLLIKTTSQGRDTDEAMENAKKIEYPLEIVGDSLTLPDGYFLNKGNPYRMQRVYVKLFLPQGKMAKFTKFPTMKRGNLFPRGIYKAVNDSIVEVKK